MLLFAKDLVFCDMGVDDVHEYEKYFIVCEPDGFISSPHMQYTHSMLGYSGSTYGSTMTPQSFLPQFSIYSLGHC